MELYEEILLHCLKESQNLLSLNAAQIVHDQVYEALRKIKMILEQDHLSDQECFCRIEEIVRVYEELGSDGGNRHDFG